MTTEQNFHIPVFIEGTTIAVYKEKGIVRHTSDLSKPRPQQCHYLSFDTLHSAEGKNAVKALWNITPVDIDAFYEGLKAEYPLDDAHASSTEASRRDFYAVYDQLPPAVKALAEAIGTRAIIALPDHKLPLISGEPSYEGYNACQLDKDLFFKAAASVSYPTVLEEVSHGIDDAIGHHAGATRFTQAKSWERAVKHDLTPANKFARDLYKPLEKEKSNTAKNNLANGKPMSVEALVDVMRIEHMLIQVMREKGDLTSLKEHSDMRRHHSIDDVMMQAMPNMWQLYRGAEPGKQLLQNHNGHVVQTGPDDKRPQGYAPVDSYLEICTRTAADYCADPVTFSACALPAPKAPAPDKKQHGRINNAAASSLAP